MDLRSLLQDILSEVSPKITNFQLELHLLITWVRSSDYFRFLESLRTCIMASQMHSFFTFSNVLLIVSHVSSWLLYIGITGSVQLLASFSKASRYLSQSAFSRSNMFFFVATIDCYVKSYKNRYMSPVRIASEQIDFSVLVKREIPAGYTVRYDE